MSDKKAGLYNKFTVTRNDGKSAEGEKHHDCEYFVLDVTHDPFAIPALQAYANACRAEYPLLAEDLDGKYPTPPQADTPIKGAGDLSNQRALNYVIHAQELIGNYTGNDRDVINAHGLIGNARAELEAAQRDLSGEDYMCENCVTPWKCNGPHLLPTPAPIDALRKAVEEPPKKC